ACDEALDAGFAGLDGGGRCFRGSRGGGRLSLLLGLVLGLPAPKGGTKQRGRGRFFLQHGVQGWVVDGGANQHPCVTLLLTCNWRANLPARPIFPPSDLPFLKIPRCPAPAGRG